MKRPLLLALAALLTAPTALAQQPPTPAATAADFSPALRRALPDLRARLEALSPANPRAYFLLGEEVAAEIQTADDRTLARRLMVLTLSTSHASPAGGRDLTPSVCYALAYLAGNESERDWLLAMARSVDEREFGANWNPALDEAPPELVAYRLATALGYVRSGDGRRAEDLLRDEAVRSLLDDVEPTLRNAGGPSTAVIQREIDTWRQRPAGRDGRAERAMVDGKPSYRLDATTSGNPGPLLSPRELLAYLRLESNLLSGRHDAWSAQVLADDGKPLRDLDPAELAGWYDIGPDESIYRRGRWITPDTDANPSPTPPAPTTDQPQPPDDNDD